MFWALYDKHKTMIATINRVIAEPVWIRESDMQIRHHPMALALLGRSNPSTFHDMHSIQFGKRRDFSR
jgi:hypothetical protein